MRNENLLSEMIKQFWVNWTDKQFLHNYAVGYYEFLKNSKINNVLEVGIYLGSSLRSWSKIFPEANVYGIDIDPSLMFKEPRITTDIADQDSIESLQNYSNKYDVKFDLIVDDGSHIFVHTKNAFDVLFSKLNDDGIYIIEDISVIPTNMGGNPAAPQQTLSEWETYLSTIEGIEYKFIDCHYGNPHYPGSWMVGIVRKK